LQIFHGKLESLRQVNRKYLILLIKANCSLSVKTASNCKKILLGLTNNYSLCKITKVNFKSTNINKSTDGYK
jgi:hypothetical protein